MADSQARSDMEAEVGVVAIVRLRHHAPPGQLLEALIAGGITRLEVTWPTPGALTAIRDWQGATDVLVGAGTIRTAAQAIEASEVGAKFLVTPTVDAGVLDAATTAGRTVFCGATTPTEIEQAYRHPAVAAVKVFPAGPLGGPGFLRAISEPLDDIPLLPTGGVKVEDIAAYAAMGCVGVAVGGTLINDDLIAARAWDEVTKRAAELVTAWKQGLEERHQ